MGRILLFIIIIVIALTTLRRPWVGVAAYYLMAILGPQYIWWWNFEGLRVSFWVALCTFMGLAYKFNINEIHFAHLKTRLNLWLLVLWICLNISYLFGPYVPLFNFPSLTPDQILTITNKIFLFYFCAVLVASDPKHLKYLGIIFVGSTIYMTYWANMQYLDQNWAQFVWGRLEGPRSLQGGSLYGDSNVLAILFVTGIPFIYYFGVRARSVWQRYSLWAIIPLSAHAIFLTGSRGGFLGLSVVIILISLKMKKKIFTLAFVLLAVVFFQWQGGQVMQERSQTITSHEGDGSVESRLTAWKVGLKMTGANPITGVGIGSFITAAPLYSDLHPMVAHNTFIHYTAESGVLAGLAYVMILYCFFFNARQISACCDQNPDLDEIPWIRMLNDASSVSFSGLIVCSLFLSLTIFEIFFFLLVFNSGLTVYLTHHTQSISTKNV